MNSYNRFEFKLYIVNTDFLCFRAIIIEDLDNKKFIPQIQQIDTIGIDEVSKNIFEKIMDRTLTLDLVLKSNIGTIKEKLERSHTIKFDNDNPIKNLERFGEYSEKYFGLSAKLKEAPLHEIFSLGFEGPDYNMKYGVNVSSYNSLEKFTQETLSIISANNTTFHGIYRNSEIAASTKIPFQAEEVDKVALYTIEALQNDINRFATEYNEYKLLESYIDSRNDVNTNLYKNLLLQIKKVKNIDNLDGFYIENNINDTKYKFDLYKVKKINYIQNSFAGQPISFKNAKFKFYRGQLENNQDIHSMEVDTNDGIKTIHISHSKNNLISIIQTLNQKDKIDIYGKTTESKKTIELTSINKV
jgi:hypothetical protein